jgi:hypothetical protein
LLDELEEVDGAVEEGGAEFAFEVDVRITSGLLLAYDLTIGVYGKLTEQ